MSLLNDSTALPGEANFIRMGKGAPVILIHGLAASLHDWDELAPELAGRGYSAYALDLLGHGESPHPASRAYQAEWLLEHLASWIASLQLGQPAILVGHSLGGYLALEFARRFPDQARALVLVNPFYHRDQLPAFLRLSYRRPSINMAVLEQAPGWLVRLIIDLTSLSMSHSSAGAHGLSVRVRAQTALDYKRTAPGAYHLPNSMQDLSGCLPQISQPSLVVWGTRDMTLAPASFPKLIARLPAARAHSLAAGHVPHQSHAAEFNARVLEFLASLPPV